MNKKLLLISISSILTLALLIFFVVVSWEVFVKDTIFLPSAKDAEKSYFNDYEDSPFGLMEVKIYQPEQVAALKDLGAKSARLAPYNNVIWERVEETRGTYDWSAPDSVISASNNAGVKTFITVGPGGDGRGPGPAKLPDEEILNWFLEFLGKVVERYDGDGIDDATGSPKIDVIQIENEVDGIGFWKDTPENYALFLKKSCQAVKKSAPDMKVSIAGMAVPSSLNGFYKPILEELNKIKDNSNDQYFDVFDFHWSGQFQGKYSEIIVPDSNMKILSYNMKQFVKDVQSELDKIGYKNVDIYITEMSDYSGTPISNPTTPGVTYETHSEKEQASSLIKRYIYSLSSGVDKIFWNNVIEDHNYGGVENGYFDNVALINNPQNDGQSHKKLSYYAYKKMTEKLEGSDWDNIETIQESDNVYIYKFIKKDSGEIVWVAWWDYFDDSGSSKTILLSDLGINGDVLVTEAVPKYDTGKEVTDYNTAFNIDTKKVNNGKVEITLNESPVFVEGN